MEPTKQAISKKYADLERKLTKKDFVGNILYLPFDPEEEYFYTINATQRAPIMEQLNKEFDIQEKLSVSKRQQQLEIVFNAGESPLPVYVFARWSKGKPGKISVRLNFKERLNRSYARSAVISAFVHLSSIG